MPTKEDHEDLRTRITIRQVEKGRTVALVPCCQTLDLLMKKVFWGTVKSSFEEVYLVKISRIKRRSRN